ncbi:MAG TPA: aminotransferase class V-fold PLP-dependent enzyme [Acidobacteriota bacterium]|nr:aminotransferase class V-fold PLP-dependent enzyme [Acidobacteriota bacterium]
MSDIPERKPQSSPPSGLTRREMLQTGSLLALPATLWSAADAVTAVEGPVVPGPRIYQSIGVEPVINCRGTFTIIGASVEVPECRAAVESAALQNVQLDELAEAVGRRLAELTGAEWGMVSAGCAAGLKHVTAACVAGGNPEKLIRIPDLSDLDKTEVVIPRSSRSVYDHAIRNIGVKVVMIDTLEELDAALNPRTALIYIQSGGQSVTGPLSLEAIARIAKPKNVPILVDAAAEILTIPNVHLQRGADIVAYSGGKAIRGPQCAGLLLGRKDILQSAWQASSPHHGPGRDNKVGREETMGMLAAVEAWIKRDHKAEWQMWLSWLDTISRQVTKIEGVTTAIREPSGLNNRSPSLIISWNPDKLNITGEEAAEEMARTRPRIALGAGGGRPSDETAADTTSISVTPWQMQPGQEKIVADRICEVLSQKRSPKPPLKEPVANLTGRWDTTVEFYNSKSEHVLFIEQNGNRIQGTHKGDFLTRDMYGIIDGEKVVLRSATSERGTGDSIIFTFAGTVSGDTISGPIHMGEYLMAKFSARRHAYPAAPTILVPKGPPLAN